MTEHHKTSEKLPLPSEQDLMVSPILATLTVLESALAMCQASLACEHLDSDYIDKHKAKCLEVDFLAQMISIQGSQLKRLVARYRQIIISESEHPNYENIPF